MTIKVEGKPARALWKLLRDDAFASLRDDFTARVAECGLSMSQGQLIRGLGTPPAKPGAAPVPRGAPPRGPHSDPPNTPALADSLEARGLIERRADASDRRFRLLA